MKVVVLSLIVSAFVVNSSYADGGGKAKSSDMEPGSKACMLKAKKPAVQQSAPSDAKTSNEVAVASASAK